MSKAKTWRKGDVIAVDVQGGFRYLQYIGRMANFGDVFRVIRFSSPNMITDASEIAHNPTSYHVCGLRAVLAADPRFIRVGEAQSSEPLPNLRRAQFGGWAVIDSAGNQISFTPLLDSSTAEMSIEELLPPGAIVDRLACDWSPSDDRDDLSVHIAKSARKSRGPGLLQISFFLEFEHEHNARQALNSLTDSAFSGEIINGAEVRVSASYASESDVAKLEAAVQAAAVKYGGSVSGHERPLG